MYALLRFSRSLILETISAKYAVGNRTGIAFVYFNYQKQDVQSSAKILATMIKQLARQKKVLPDELKQFYRKHYRDAEPPNEKTLEAQFSELSNTFDQVFIVMDAMDEFDDRKTFLPVITRLVKDSSRSITFKIFVTSRRERDIATHFTKCGFPTIQIEAKKVDTDIAAFVQYQINQRDGDGYGFVYTQALKEEIAHTLTSKSNGM